MAAEDYHDMSQIVDFEYHSQFLESQVPERPIRRRLRKSDKPLLIKCGNQLISPLDVAGITQVRTKAIDEDGTKHTLYIVHLKSNPNPEYPIWVRGESNISKLLQYFNVEE